MRWIIRIAVAVLVLVLLVEFWQRPEVCVGSQTIDANGVVAVFPVECFR